MLANPLGAARRAAFARAFHGLAAIALSGAFASGIPQFAEARVTRGPFLQSASPSGIIIKWRSDLGTTPRVAYGPAPGNLTTTATGTIANGHFEVPLVALQSNTVYYYQVQDGPNPVGDATYRFKTPPNPGTRQPIRVWVTGDPGTGNPDSRAVADAYRGVAATRAADLWLMLGDNAYNSGTDSEYQWAVFETYPDLLRSITLWPTLCNHDGGGANSNGQTGPYYDIFSLPKADEAGGVASGTEAYYSFDHGNVHFVVLESYQIDRSANGAMANWLRQDLQNASTRAGVDRIIAYWHHPPYSKGSHNSDIEPELIGMRQNIVPILEQYGVDLVLTGHSHGYERSYLLNGHYGLSSTLTSAMVLNATDGRGANAYTKPRGPNSGTVYVVQGSSGSANPTIFLHPAMAVALPRLGSLLVDINGERLDVSFLREAGAIDDTFTIVKGDAPGGGGGGGGPIGATDLELAWSAPSPADPGQFRTFTATLTVRNTGTAAATGVEIALPYPSDLRHSSGRASQGSFSPWGEYVWRVGAIAPGQSATLDLTLFTMNASRQTVFAQVMRADQPDRDSTPGNGASPTPREDDEAVLVANAGGTPPACTPPVARITASVTAGNAPLTVTFTDASTGATARQWNFAGGAPTSATGTVVTVVYATPGTYAASMTATVAPGCSSSVSTNITVGSVAGGTGADLELAFTPPSPPRPGQYASFATTLTVRNTGTGVARNVGVALPYPSDLRHVSVSASQGSFVPWAAHR